MKKLFVVVLIILAFFIGFSMQFVFPDLHHSDDEHLNGTTHDEMHMGDDDSHMHMHEMMEVDPELPVPAVELEVTKDAKGGYNVYLFTENFLFTPELATDYEARANQGHAHLYVNDVKVARVYSEWFHLGDEYFTAGENIVRVTLNTNDHLDWAVDGETIAAETIMVVE